MCKFKKGKKEGPMDETETLMTAGDTARFLIMKMGIARSHESVKLWAKDKKLPSIKTSGGITLFKQSDVIEFAQKYLKPKSERVTR